MLDTSNVGNVEQSGSQLTPLERLRPYQIATMLVPGTNVQVRDATDAQFQSFVSNADVRVHVEDDEPDANTWSFDDRVRFINYCRCRYGVDLFVEPNKNNSEPEQKQFGINSETELIGELFEGHEAARQELLATIGEPTSTKLRDDIDMLIAQLEKSSSGEQKEFGAGE